MFHVCLRLNAVSMLCTLWQLNIQAYTEIKSRLFCQIGLCSLSNCIDHFDKTHFMTLVSDVVQGRLSPLKNMLEMGAHSPLKNFKTSPESPPRPEEKHLRSELADTA